MQPPQFKFYDAQKPIYTSPRFLPPTAIEKCSIKKSIISHGCFLRECKVEHSIVGIRARLEKGADLKVRQEGEACGVSSLQGRFWLKICGMNSAWFWNGILGRVCGDCRC